MVTANNNPTGHHDRILCKTPQKLKLIDAYLGYIMLTGIFQFAYCCLVSTFPFNAFLSGFISSVASFILGVCLRIQTNPANMTVFKDISVERAFADFIFAHCVLHLVVMKYELYWLNSLNLLYLQMKRIEHNFVRGRSHIT